MEMLVKMAGVLVKIAVMMIAHVKTGGSRVGGPELCVKAGW